MPGQAPDKAQWTALRTELARIAGIVIFVGGVKIATTTALPEIADGVLEEFEAAKAANCFIIPIGSTGGAAAQISDNLIGSAMETSGHNAMRPTDDELKEFARGDITADEIVILISNIFTRIDKRA